MKKVDDQEKRRRLVSTAVEDEWCILKPHSVCWFFPWGKLVQRNELVYFMLALMHVCI